MEHLGKMPKKTGGRPQQINAGGARHEPNGGSARTFSGPSLGKMGKQTRGAPVTHTPLDVMQRDDVHDGQTDSSVKMPKQTGGAPQRDPFRR